MPEGNKDCVIRQPLPGTAPRKKVFAYPVSFVYREKHVRESCDREIPLSRSKASKASWPDGMVAGLVGQGNDSTCQSDICSLHLLFAGCVGPMLFRRIQSPPSATTGDGQRQRSAQCMYWCIYCTDIVRGFCAEATCDVTSLTNQDIRVGDAGRGCFSSTQWTYTGKFAFPDSRIRRQVCFTRSYLD